MIHLQRLGIIAIATAALAVVSPAAPWAATQENEDVTARVTNTVAGTGIVIDRGTRDGLEIGDRVEFNQRGGSAQFGTVIELEGRNAIVRPEDPAFNPQPGVRATVSIPVARFDEPSDPVVPAPVPDENTGGNAGDAPPPGAGEVPARPPAEWTNKDEDWNFDMPLLAEVKAVKPERRPMSLSGRGYLNWNRIIDSEQGRGDSFLRAGGAVFAENLFGHGGTLHFDAEWNARMANVPDDDDESDRTLRLDRLSYTYGGHRHDWTSIRAGRFLHDGMPEFGVLDGASWSQRRENGDSYGASVGFLPEPDKDQQSFEDFQMSGWYRWVADERERLSVTSGFQKTWHNGTRDRDLIVSRLQYAPDKGWNVFSTVWLDLYGVGDNVKDSGPALTYMILDASRELGKKSGIDVEYRHQEYPELRRNEYAPVGLTQLADARVDRLGATAWRWITPKDNDKTGLRGYARAGGWSDEEDQGSDGELGLEFHDVMRRGDRLDLAGFVSNGKFSKLLGGRVRVGRYGPKRSWSLQYEIRLNDIIGFNNDNDDLIQHRARGSYEFYRASGLSASLSAEVQLQDREDQVFLGFFLQRAF